MSPEKTSGAKWPDGARQAAAQLRPAAERAKPIARSTGQAARRQLLRTRAWAAPRVEHSGQVLQDRVAPKVSAIMSEAARRLDPAQPRQRGWRKPAGVVATLTAAGGVVAAFIRNRNKAVFRPSQTGTADTKPTTIRNGQPSTGPGTDAEANSQVHPS
jgi:hypothetical protein